MIWNVAPRVSPLLLLLSLTIARASRVPARASPDGRLIRVDEEQDVALWELDPVQTRLHCISVALLGRHSELPVAVSSLGASIVPLRVPPQARKAAGHAAGESATPKAIGANPLEGMAGLSALVTRVELTQEGSSTLLRLCSLVQVHNATDQPLDIGLKKASVQTPSRHSQREPPLPPDVTIAAEMTAAEGFFTTANPHVRPRLTNWRSCARAFGRCCLRRMPPPAV